MFKGKQMAGPAKKGCYDADGFLPAGLSKQVIPEGSHGFIN
jgi:hypothetical protein